MWPWIKLPKAVALIAFFLPWMTVSCGSTKLVKATGWGLATGRFTAAMPRLGPSVPRLSDGGEINTWLIAAIAAIVVGLVIACLPRTRATAAGVLATSLAALGLIWMGTSRYTRDSLTTEAARSRHEVTFDSGVIQVDWHFGFWLALGMLVLSAVLALLVLGGRDAALRQSLADAIAPPDPPPDPQ